MSEKLKNILKRRKLDQKKEDIDLEKNDFLAILIAAASVFLPVLIVVFVLIALLVWLMFYL